MSTEDVISYSCLKERKKIGKCQKLVFNMYNKKNYVAHIKALKLALDYKLILDKMNRIIESNKQTSTQN